MGLGDFEGPTGSGICSGTPKSVEAFPALEHERKGVGIGVLTQTLGGHPVPVAYLSVKLDHTVQGWPTCLRAVVATCEHLQEAEKFSLGQPVTTLCASPSS